MMRKGLKKLLTTVLTASMLITAVPIEHLYAAERYQPVNVEKEEVPVSEMSVYKDMDDSFLKEFSYGESYTGTVDAKIITATDMIACKDARIKENRIIQTGGFYKEGDGGAATYKISTEKENGAVALENGLYAILIPDTVQIQENTWAIVNTKQLGSIGDGKQAENNILNDAIGTANVQSGKEEIFRSIVYIPSGEYKCTHQVYMNAENVNIVGDGDDTVIFTDNDYESYYEFFMWSSGAKNLYLGNFKVEAREKDMSRYYRQMVFVDSSNVYMYQVNMNIPQEAFSKDYFVDKQYTNLTFYAGNKDMTVDSCRMELMCSTYRGANLGILDFYCRGEENITVMNCELYDNARDEQVGIFTGVTNRDASFIKNVHFINNKVYSYTPLDKSAAGGYRTMCFTVAYNESRNIEDIYIEGNHFISQADSKFMTFGNVDNCVVKNNIIEADCTGNNGSYIFEAGTITRGDVKVDNNEIYITRYGKACVCSGPIEFTNNRLLSDGPIGSILYQPGTVEGNEIISLKSLGQIIQNATVCNNNTITAYGSFDGLVLVGGGGDYEDTTAYIQNNTVKDYEREYLIDSRNPFEAAGTIRGSFTKELIISGNTYLTPNRFVAESQESTVQKPRGILYCNGATLEKIQISDNTFQQIDNIRQYGCDMQSVAQYSNNNIVDYNEYAPEKEMYSEVYITQNGEKVTEIYTTEDGVTLGSNVTENADWYTSVESLATVKDGVVTRKQYGDVTVFVIPENGSKDGDGNVLYGKCIVHFQKAKATDIKLSSTSITMEKGRKNDIVYQVTPVDKVSQALQWETSDESIATVSSDGIIEAVAPGMATITGRTADGSNLSAQIQVTVVEKTVKKITLNTDVWDNNEAGVTIGEKKQLEVSSYIPYDAVNKGVSKWVSLNEQVATVDENGLVTAVGQGHTEIRAYSMDNYCYGSCTVWVNPVPITGLTEEHSQDSVTLRWEEQENADGYKIYLYNQETSSWNLKYTQKNTEYRAYSKTVGSYIEPDTDYKFAVTAYSERRDQNGYRHYYENKDSTISLHTYKDKVITSFGNNIPASVAVTEGGKSKVSVYKDKTLFTYYIEDTSVATVEDVSPNGDAALEITGVKEGKTYLYLKALDEKAYTKKIPVLVHNFETFTLEATGGIKSVIAKWQVQDMDKVEGFRFIRSWVVNDKGLDIPVSEITTEQNGEMTNCSYVLSGLENSRSYSITVQPYVIMDDTIYAGGGSGKETCTTIDYVNVDTILTEDVLTLTKGQEQEITVKMAPENATEPKPDFIIFDKSIADVTEEKQEEDYVYTAKIKGEKLGVTAMNVVACDDNNYTKTIQIAVVPEKVTELNAKSDSSTVTLTWNKTHENAEYLVYRKTQEETTWNKIAQVTKEKYTDSGLKPQTVYQYKIAAFITDKESNCYEGETSEECSITTKKVTVVTRDEPEVSVKPTEEVKPSDIVKPSEEAKPSEGAKPSGEATPTITPIMPSKTAPKPSQVAKPTKTPENSTQKVTGFKLKKATKSSVTLTWKKVQGANGYEVSVYKNKKWKRVSKVAATTTRTTVNKLAGGKKYKFRIRCITSKNQETKYGAPVYCYGVTKPAKVVIKKVTRKENKAKLQWKRTSCDGYQIKYAATRKMKNAKTITVNSGRITTKTIKRLNRKKVYYVKVRAFKKLNGKKYYGSYSKVSKITLTNP